MKNIPEIIYLQVDPENEKPDDFSEQEDEILEHKNIKSDCDEKINIIGNIECLHQRGIISGLGGCLCNERNCYKMRGIKTENKQGEKE